MPSPRGRPGASALGLLLPRLPLPLALLALSASLTALAPGAAHAATTSPLVIAHRGGAAARPENTMAAFRHAVRLGAGMVETDVHRTADGYLVLAHDATPRRTCDGPGQRRRWSALTIRQVAALDCQGHHVPRLSGLAALVARSPRVGLLLEIKTSPGRESRRQVRRTVRAAVRVLRAYGISGRTSVQSFDWRAIDAPVLQRHGIATCGLMSPTRLRWHRPGPSPWLDGLDIDDYRTGWPGLAHAARLRRGMDAVAVRHDMATRRRVARAHRYRASLQVYAWTVNVRAEYARLRAVPVDGIVTDWPRGL